MSAFAYFKCSLCGYSPNVMKWTSSFHAILGRAGGDIILTEEKFISRYGASFLYETFISRPTGEIRVRLERGRIKTPSVTAYLIHTLCLKTLQDMLKEKISLESLFLLSRALEREYEKDDVLEIPVSEACFDPPELISTLLSFDSADFAIAKSPTKIDTLPLEIKLLIISHLDSRSLMSYLHSSHDALLSAESVPSYQLLYSYVKAIKIQDMVVSAYHNFQEEDYPAFESLLLWLENMVSQSRYLEAKLPVSLPNHSLAAPFALGHRKLEVDISAATSGLRVYLISIQGKNYISGIEGIPPSCGLIGACSSVSRNIDFHTENINKVGFLVDSLGLRSLRIGDGTWSSGTPHQLDCFEGFSVTGDSKKLIVLADALKFRRISWEHSVPGLAPSLSETIVMKPQHIGIVLPENYICRSKSDNAWSIDNFGVVTTESVMFNDDIYGVSMYYRNVFGMSGICVHSDTLQSAGRTDGTEMFFPICRGKERISSIIVRSDNISLALQVCTTLGRHHLFGQAETPNKLYVYKTLAPSTNQSLYGCCLQFGHFGLESVGIICCSSESLEHRTPRQICASGLCEE
ncbi:hypothetical protein HYALB_00000667 [Hymenoscyphus albidus]|uniref:F-box domain-containing protein n=1 Tax=Hymenoscyphus albidus TaxID=595503 RepID=A0A9N9PX12_9HELO|nr:hypothetical protein HYALB_00000667 [Hymenoscyphus albidus]